jgi:5'-nucleotidase
MKNEDNATLLALMASIPASRVSSIPTSTPITFNLWLPIILVPEEEGSFQLTILHTNDFHAHVEQYNADGSTCEAGDTCLGGSSRLKTKIDEIRNAGKNVLLLDAGDEFQGTLYYGLFKSEVIANMMNALGYDAMTVGNHEFDDGPEELARLIDEVGFPLISANIDVSAEPFLAGKIAPSAVLTVDGEQIGIVGATTMDAEIISSPGPNVIFNDVTTSVQAAVDNLTGQGVDKIIALTHQGYNEDIGLAQTVTGLDVIVGGHSHTFTYWPTGPVRFEPPTFPKWSDMTPAGAYPTVATAPDGNPTIVVTAYQWGTFLGNLNVVFDPAGVVLSYDGDPIFMANTVAQDAAVEALLDPYRDAVNELRNTVIAESAVDMPIDAGGEDVCRSGECLLGSLVADSMLWKVNSIIVDPADKYQIALQNGGGLRAPLVAGPISRGDVLETLPFGNTIATFGLTGAHMIEALENGVGRVGGTSGTGRFPQVSGIRYTYDPNAAVGSRIVSVELRNPDGSYSPLDPATVYKVVTNDFMRTGGDGYSVLNDHAIDPYDFGPALDEAVSEYMTLISPIEAADIPGGRIIELP